MATNPSDIDTEVMKKIAEKHARACMTKFPISIARNRDVMITVQETIERALHEYWQKLVPKSGQQPPPSL